MKTCKYCGTQAEDSAQFCTACGAAEFTGGQSAVPTQPAPVDINDNGNVLSGVVGAFLFALIGGFLYFVVYQAGFIVGLCGLVMFILASFGYRLLAGTKNTLSLAGLIASVVATVVMIFVAEYVSIAFAVYQEPEIKSYYTFAEVLQELMGWMQEADTIGDFAQELGMAYLFAFIASISNIVNVVKARKAAK